MEARRKIATDVLGIIRAQLVSSNQIIPRVQIPVVFPKDAKEQAQLKQKFGAKYELFASYIEKLNVSRKLVMQVLSLLVASKEVSAPAPMLMNLAVAGLGIGECGESVHYAYHEIANTYPKEKMLILAFHKDKKYVDGVQNHGVLLLGSKADFAKIKKSNKLSVLKKLPNDCLLFDPFLGVICQANQYDQSPDLMAYLKAYDFGRVALWSGQEKYSGIGYELRQKDIKQTLWGVAAILQLWAEKSHLYATELQALAFDHKAAVQGNGSAATTAAPVDAKASTAQTLQALTAAAQHKPVRLSALSGMALQDLICTADSELSAVEKPRQSLLAGNDLLRFDDPIVHSYDEQEFRPVFALKRG